MKNNFFKSTQNIPIYTLIYQKIDRAKKFGEIDGIDKIPPFDNAWVDNTSTKAQTQLESLLAEFKRQKDEAVKVKF